MQKYSPHIIDQVRTLRSLGKTYSEIRLELHREYIPKSTLSEWCKQVILPPDYKEKIIAFNKENLHKGRLIALVANKRKREKLLKEIQSINIPISLKIQNKNIGKIALAMLCLGEASKSTHGASNFYLGSSDPKIIIIFLSLLKKCFPFSLEKIRATVQCRADQNITALESFWVKKSGIPKRLFYKAQIDPRTKGKPTKKKDYKGVLRIDYFDTRLWLELESLAEKIYNQLS